MAASAGASEQLLLEGEALRRRVAVLELEAQRFEAALYSIGDAVIATDGSGLIVRMNGVAAALTGWSEAEALGRPASEVFRIVNEESGAEVEDPVARVLREGSVVGLANHTLLVAHEGPRRPIADGGAPIRDGSGAVAGVVLVFRDRTEERRADQGLRLAEERFRTFFDNAPIGKCMTAPDGRLLRVNPAFGAMLGYSAEELQSISFASITHPDDVAESRECIRALLSGERDTWEMEKRYLARDGRHVWTHVTTRLQRDDAARPLHFLTHIQDITARKAAEQALREARERLEEAQRAAGLGNWQWDAVEDEITGSEEFYRLFDIAPRDLARFPQFIEQLHPDDRERVRRDVAEALRQDRPYDTDYRVKLRGGGWRDINARGRVFTDPAGDPTRMVGTCVDITERRRAEQALRESEGRFRATFDQAAVGFAQVGLDGRWLRVNQRLCAIVGYTEDELLALTFQDITHPDDLNADLEYVRQILAGEIPTYSMEKRYIRKDRSLVWIYLTVGLVRDEAGAPDYFVSVVEDVTDRKRAEAELRVKNQVFEDSIASQSVADEKGVITHVNPAFLRLWGYVTKEEALGQSVASFFANPADARPVLEALAAYDGWEGEFLARRADGGTFVSRGYATSLRNASGELIGYQSTNLDVTDLHRAEDELRQSEARFRQLTESLPQLVWTCRADGPCDYLSPQWVAYTGIPAADQLEYRWLEQIHPDDRERVIAEWGAVAPRGGAFDIEFRIRRHDGVHRWFRTRALPLKDERGQVLKWFGSNTDIEDMRQTADALTRSNQELEQFAYVASHDLQEPLRMVASFTQLLAQRYQEQLDQDAREFIGFAVDGANRMQRLIQDLLEYSRVTTRGRPPAALDAHDALGEAVRNLQVAIQESGALVTNDDLPLIRGDHTQVVQVFQNLIANGLKFRKPGEPPQVHVSAAQNAEQPGFWTFKVVDNGIGIEPRHFERLFVIFQRLHGKQEYPGTGIGLALCKRIVERHGGKIWLASEPGQGTTVFFTWPSAHRGEGAQRWPASPATR